MFDKLNEGGGRPRITKVIGMRSAAVTTEVTRRSMLHSRAISIADDNSSPRATRVIVECLRSATLKESSPLAALRAIRRVAGARLLAQFAATRRNRT